MRDLVTRGGSSVRSSDYVAAAAAPDGSLLVAYTPPDASGSFDLDLGVMRGPARGRWFDPASGAYRPIDASLPTTGPHTFTVPGANASGARDWVLVLESASGLLAAHTIWGRDKFQFLNPCRLDRRAETEIYPDPTLTPDVRQCRDDMSITNRYFTSLRSIRSNASLMYDIGMTSTSETMPWVPQKSSISCVSARPPMSDPAMLRRWKIRPIGFGDW